jgi:hypothetical protein
MIGKSSMTDRRNQNHLNPSQPVRGMHDGTRSVG